MAYGVRVFVVWLVVSSQASVAIRWLGIRHDSDHTWKNTECKKMHGFAGKQYNMCRRNLPIMRYVTEAVEMTREECQYQLQNRRWNCTTIKRAPRFLPDLKRGTREAAYVYALSAAALTYTVTRACSTGRLVKACKCGKNPKIPLKNKEWEWGGCSDNIAYGERFSKRFTDVVEEQRMAKHKAFDTAIMNTHNSGVGRKAVRNMLEIICKCHGVSGGCQTKTCFRRLSDFRPVAGWLKRRYDRVVYVVSSNVKANRKRRVLKPKRGGRDFTTRDLIALQGSPNYCNKNRRRGSLGTRGRLCDPSKRDGEGSCGYMCCGRGKRTKDVIIEERCNCRYVWCCYVKCQKCRKQIKETRCN